MAVSFLDAHGRPRPPRWKRESNNGATDPFGLGAADPVEADCVL
jgi:hypothetical protein